MLVKFRAKHLALYKLIKEGGIFLLIFIIVFAAVFAAFNGRAFYEQIKYKLGINLIRSDEFLNKLPIAKETLYDINDSVVIAKININAPIIFSRSTENKQLLKELENGVVHYADSVFPGQIGNSIILGHSSAYPWYKGKYGSVFSLLNQLDESDEIIVFYQKHQYIYKVVSKEIVKKNTIIPDQNERSQLILISCWPIGTDWNRILI